MTRVRHLGGLGSIASAGGGGGVPQFLAASSNHAASGTVTVTKPAGVQDGDLLVGMVVSSVGSSGATLTIPAGWMIQRIDTANSGFLVAVVARWANSEGSSYSFTWSSGNSTLAALVAYRGARGFNVVGDMGVTASSATIGTAPDIVPSASGLLLALFASKGAQASIITPPSGMTQRLAALTVAPAVAIYDQAPSPSGSPGSKSITFPTANRIAANLLQIVG